MEFASENKNRPNWLLRGLTGVSLAIHLVLLMHVAGVYQSKAMTYIELTLNDISKPFTRSIPRPRLRPKAPAQPNQIKKLNITKRIIPTHRPMKVAAVEKNLPDSLVESVSMPDIPCDPGLKISQWNPGTQIGTSDYVTSNDYFQMVRLKIESRKKYPVSAKNRQIEGRTTIRFVIAADGHVTSLEVVKSARHKELDQAALSAVKKASPFPRPPGNLLKGSIPLEITIIFELA